MVEPVLGYQSPFQSTSILAGLGLGIIGVLIVGCTGFVITLLVACGVGVARILDGIQEKFGCRAFWRCRYTNVGFGWHFCSE